MPYDSTPTVDRDDMVRRSQLCRILMERLRDEVDGLDHVVWHAPELDRDDLRERVDTIVLVSTLAFEELPEL